MKYFIRLDDACEKRDIKKWDRIEQILDSHNLCPLVGLIPHCEDIAMEQFEEDPYLWEKVNSWKKKGWEIALHGYNHVCTTNIGGINPINKRSEFAGIPLELQKEKIKQGIDILREHGIEPKVFFAPSHTFDENTLKALRDCSDIRTISDTIAYKPYMEENFTFIPQQSGHVRMLPLNTVTFCYHPNTMKENDFTILDNFIHNNRRLFCNFEVIVSKRKENVIDRILRAIYFMRHL